MGIQTSNVTLSTTEAEYVALSRAMREVIPMQFLLKELNKCTKLDIGQTITYSTVFEDNKGCIELVNCPKLRPRSKHIHIKYHHFREHVTNGTIKVEHIPSSEQLADIFTKPLPLELFAKLRRGIIGW